MRRRDWLRAAASGSGALLFGHRPAAAAPPGGIESADFRQHDLRVPGDARIAQRALLLEPTHVKPGTRLPLLVLLHGLGETGNETLGMKAWSELYGLIRAHERLRRPPATRTQPKARYLTDEHAAELNRSLQQRPYRSMAIACPVTPNPHRLQPAADTLDRYADWLADALVPAIAKRVPLLPGPEHRSLDGCSLGGYVGIEVFLRKPDAFGSFGGVQSAFGVPTAVSYAERLAATIARVGARPLRFGTSSTDPYRAANEALAKRLEALGVPRVLSVLPGPHNQPWLREVGTLDMLLWHDRQLGGPVAPLASDVRDR